MSHLSGFDSESIGFDSVTPNKNTDSHNSTQTTEFSESSAGTQTNTSNEGGTNISPGELSQNDVPQTYPPPGLNEFLRRVVPAMLEQLDQTDRDVLYNSSDSDEEDLISAKLVQEIKVNGDMTTLGGGDNENASILSVSWSSAGNSLAVSIGRSYHDQWCEHEGLIRIYTVKRTEGDRFVHNMDISEKSCMTVVKYHPTVAALLAYGTTSGEVVLCNLRNVTSGSDQGMQLTSPPGFHGSLRVSALQWADATLANTFLTMQVMATGKRRSASDQILVSSGCDGTVNVWQVNANLQVFQNVVTYKINGSQKMEAPDISCFDFLKTFPLRPSEEKNKEDIFVVGTTSGKLYLCNINNCNSIVDSAMVDPVFDVFEGHSTCVLDVAFNFQKPGIFASISMDSELRVYDVNQTAPLKVISMEDALSCMGWVPNNPCLVIVGLAKVDKNGQMVKVYNISSGRAVPMEVLSNKDGGSTITSIGVNQISGCRVAAGDTTSTVRIWDMPLRRLKLSYEDLEF